MSQYIDIDYHNEDWMWLNGFKPKFSLPLITSKVIDETISRWKGRDVSREIAQLCIIRNERDKVGREGLNPTKEDAQTGGAARVGETRNENS